MSMSISGTGDGSQCKVIVIHCVIPRVVVGQSYTKQINLRCLFYFSKDSIK
jgi:hypothetical protein